MSPLWFVVLDKRSGRKLLTQRPTRYRNDETRYSVWGPFNEASARFQLFEQGRNTHNVIRLTNPDTRFAQREAVFTGTKAACDQYRDQTPLRPNQLHVLETTEA